MQEIILYSKNKNNRTFRSICNNKKNNVKNIDIK